MLNKKLLGSVSSLPSDENFENVSLLLSGDGTNGAQNNTFLDSSTNNFTITRNGNTTQGSFSPYGTLWSNFFNGSSNLSCNVSGISAGTNTFTLEFWVFLNAYPGSGSDAPFVDTRSSNGVTTTAFQFGVYSTGALKLYDGTETNLGGTVPRNQWTHIALVRNGSNVVTPYINGTATGTTVTSTRNFSDNFFWIGCVPGPSSPYINAYLSNLRWVVGSALYTTTFTPSTTPLTAVTNTQLLTCQSNRFVDNSSNNRTITVAGTPSVQRFSPFNPTAPYSTSVIGGSGYFDGSGDYLNTGTTSQPVFSGDFTIGGWVYVTSFANTQILATNIDNNAASEFSIFIATDGSVKFYVNTLNTLRISSSAGAIKANEWNYIAMARSSNVVTGYVNGISAGTYSFSGAVGASTKRTYIGNESPLYGNHLSGYISDFVMTATPTTTVPSAPTASAGTSLLLSFTNAGISDLAMQNNLETVGNAQVSTSVKKYGTGSLYFDGDGDSLKTVNAIPVGTGNATVEFWIYPTSSSVTYRAIFDSRSTAGTNTGFGIFQYGLTIEVYGNGLKVSSAASALTIDAWNHVALTRSSGTCQIYINGVASGSSGSYSDNLTSTSIIIGNTPSGTAFPYLGYIDDLRVTNGLARYTTTFTPPTTLPTY